MTRAWSFAAVILHQKRSGAVFQRVLGRPGLRRANTNQFQGANLTTVHRAPWPRVRPKAAPQRCSPKTAAQATFVSKGEHFKI